MIIKGQRAHMGIITGALHGYELHLRAAGRRPGTIEQRLGWARRLTRELPDWQHATTAELEAWLACPSWAPETRKAARASARCLYGWALAAGEVEVDPSAGLAPVRVPEAQPRPAPERVLAQALEAAVDDSDRLALLLAATMGLRRGEIAAAHTEDLLDGWLLVRGKGGKDRMVPLSPRVQPYLPASGPLVPSRLDGGHLTPAHVGRRLSRLLGPGWTAHTLRHRFAGVAHASTHDLRAVQGLLGHSSLATTQRYVPVRPDVMVAAVAAA
jgi:integrase